MRQFWELRADCACGEKFNVKLGTEWMVKALGRYWQFRHRHCAQRIRDARSTVEEADRD